MAMDCCAFIHEGEKKLDKVEIIELIMDIVAN